MDPLFLGLGMALAVFVSATIGLFLARANAQKQLVRAEADLAERDGELGQARGNLGELETRLAATNAELKQLENLRAELQAERTNGQAKAQELAALKAQMDEREVGLEREKQALAKMGAEVQAKFQALATEVLETSQKKLTETARANLGAQQEKAVLEFKSLVNPVGENLKALRDHVEQVEKQRLSDKTGLIQQIQHLSEGLNRQQGETAKLVNALQRSSTTRGQWGERTVENILELAGLTKGIDYESQHQTRSAEGEALRPDFVVRLPGGGRFVIDSKVALTAYLDAVDAVDEAGRKEALGRHAQQVRTHVKQLAKKDYASAVDGAIDFVALFIPGESFYSAAIDEDPNLFDEAVKAGVIITTPATLLALAKAVSYGWRQQQLEDNAEKISALGAELYERLSTFSGHLDRVGSGLRSATSNYNKAVSSLESRVLVSGRKLAELNGNAQKTIEPPKQVEENPRALAAPDAAE